MSGNSCYYGAFDQYNTSGMYLAALSRVVGMLDFAIDGTHKFIPKEDLKKIGI